MKNQENARNQKPLTSSKEQKLLKEAEKSNMFEGLGIYIYIIYISVYTYILVDKHGVLKNYRLHTRIFPGQDCLEKVISTVVQRKTNKRKLHKHKANISHI